LSRGILGFNLPQFFGCFSTLEPNN
jgi:hypothetical protein